MKLECLNVKVVAALGVFTHRAGKVFSIAAQRKHPARREEISTFGVRCSIFDIQLLFEGKRFRMLVSGNQFLGQDT